MISAPARTDVIAYAGNGATRIESRTLPAPAAGEVLLRLRVSGLCGTDLFKMANDAAPPGTVLGHEIVGVVETVGSEVTRFSPGDRVVVPHHAACGACALCRRGSETLCPTFRESVLDPGGFSERVVVRERGVRFAMRAIPRGISDEAAVFLEPAACVLRGIRRAGLPYADPHPASVAILGAGSMGLLHLLVLRAVAPGTRVAVVEPMEERRRLAIELGADDISPMSGFDAVFDTVGGASALVAAIGMTREGGTVVLFAHAPSGERAGFAINDLFKHERRIVATYSGALADQQTIFDLIASGRLDASQLVTHRLPLGRFDEAVALCVSRKALKVLLTFP